MKARILFYFLAIAVLLATLAAIPSHATERRDPQLIQDAAQTSSPGHADSAAKPVQSSAHGRRPSAAKHAQSRGVNPLPEAKEKATAQKSTSQSTTSK